MNQTHKVTRFALICFTTILISSVFSALLYLSYSNGYTQGNTIGTLIFIAFVVEFTFLPAYILAITIYDKLIEKIYNNHILTATKAALIGMVIGGIIDLIIEGFILGKASPSITQFLLKVGIHMISGVTLGLGHYFLIYKKSTGTSPSA